MAGDEPPPVVTNAKRGAALAAVVLLFIAGVTLAFRPVIQDGDIIAIRSVHTGKYLALGSDGKLRASAATSSLPAARFRLVALTKTTVATFRKRPVAPLKEHGKLGCDCTGETDEHGFGRYCHNWESEFHRPWCYVNGTSCKQGLRSKRHSSRHLQVCSQEEGYLGPEGWEPAAGCACSGRESIHGFGGFCRGWEFVGQTPWCYTNNDCPDATGPEGAKYKDCIQLAQPPPPPSPPPPPPAPPPPPSPPPVKIIESKSGWGTPEQCPCSGWSSKHGFGAYCKGWELEGQTPWCYVTEACPTTMTAGGSFAHRYIQCTEVQGTLSKLLGRRLQSNGPAATARSKRLNASAKKPKAPGKPVKHATARLKTPLLPGKGVPKKRPIRHEASWAAAKSLLLRKADRLPLYALQSTENGRFVDVDPPPDKFALFAHADSTSLSLSSVFALPSSGRGNLISLGTEAFVSLCQDNVGLEWAACTATPPILKAPRAIEPSLASAHHRKLLVHLPYSGSALSMQKVAAFEVVRLSRT
mmetsp:Transcript_29464/g.93157  ORF Transcript_29464/g.93157 Transcript_29464/m.93157 type:complete len:527 (-) Transcript_29464:260-1840(-)